MHDTVLVQFRTPAPASAVEGEPLVSVENLSVSFPQYGREAHVALREVDLVIGKGELIGLVGESGAGKTTLARAIMGKIKKPGQVDQGAVKFCGQSLADLPDEKQRELLGHRISMIVANPRSELNPVLTVGNQIANVIRYHKKVDMKQARERALEMLKAVKIPDAPRRMDSYPHELSGGMAQRVVIAIALACSPEFVISDDATSGLDVTVQTQVLNLISDLVRERSASALFITRDIAIAAHYCTRIVILYGGEIVEVAGTDSFFDHPAHPYSLALLSAFAHNEDLRRRWKVEAEEVSTAATACPFAPRCVRRQAVCAAERPRLTTIREGHQVRCHFPVED